MYSGLGVAVILIVVPSSNDPEEGFYVQPSIGVTFVSKIYLTSGLGGSS